MYITGRVAPLEEGTASAMALRGVHLPYVQEKAKRPKELKQSEQGEKWKRSEQGQLEGGAEHGGVC